MIVRKLFKKVFQDLSPDLAIEPNRGLAQFSFGASPSQTKDYLGEPDEVYTIVEGLNVGWYYSRFGLAVHFFRFLNTGELALRLDDNGSVMRLAQFTGASRRLRLWGNKILQKPRSEVLAILTERGYPQIKHLDRRGYPKGAIKVEELNLYLYFEGDRLQTVQWEARPTEWPTCHRFPEQ